MKAVYSSSLAVKLSINGTQIAYQLSQKMSRQISPALVVQSVSDIVICFGQSVGDVKTLIIFA